MTILVLAGALALALPQQQIDTTIAVRAGGTLEVDAFNGSVRVATWDRAAVRVRGTHPARTTVEIDSDGSTVSVEPDRERGMPDPVQLEITVPRRFGIEIDGLHLPITIDGVQGTIDLENVEGAIIVRNVTGSVDIESVSAGIVVDNVRGDVNASSVNQAVQLSSIAGDISAETVNGAIVMRGIDASSVEASTVNGLVEYAGTISDGGHYYLGTHNGRITMAIPEQVNARLAIATYNGKVEAAFPVQIRSGNDREFDIVLGSGAATIELESHNGSVYLVRPGGR